MMARTVSPILIASILAAAASLASAERASPARVVKCEGPFGRNASHDDLVKAFGAANVVYQDVAGAEGEKVKATVLFPTDRKARLEVFWSDENARRGPMLRVKDQSAWASPNGIHIGMALADVEKLNGKPFKLQGFGKDGLAPVSDWNGGSFNTWSADCKLGLRLKADSKATAEARAAVAGEKEFLSSDAAIRALKPSVGEILLAYQE